MKVIHIIPCDGIGGVEVAAKKMQDKKVEKFQFELFYLVDRNNKNFKKQLWNPLVYIKCLQILFSKKPDIVILSLWRSVIVGLLLKILRRKVKLIYFVHSSITNHFLDGFFTKCAIRASSVIFCDSNQSLNAIVPVNFHFKARVISFVTNPITRLSFGNPSPTFIFWGRLSEQKNLYGAIDLFSLIKKRYSQAHFTIIGPDDGELKGLIKEIRRLNLESNISFTGGLNLESIKNYASRASFYLQTSKCEGMAMSVVEAMQMGLVPIVTRVGEIADYCNDGENALIIDSSENIIDRVEMLINNTVAFEALRSKACSTWLNKKLYAESLTENLIEIKKDYYRSSCVE